MKTKTLPLKSKDEQLAEFVADELFDICTSLCYDIPAYADLYHAIKKFKKAVCIHSFVCDSVDSGPETSVTIYQCVLCEHIVLTPPDDSDNKNESDYDESGAALSESGEPVALNPRVLSARINSSDKQSGPLLLVNPDEL